MSPGHKIDKKNIGVIKEPREFLSGWMDGCFGYGRSRLRIRSPAELASYEVLPLITSHLWRIPDTAWSLRVFKTYKAQPLITSHLWRIPDTAWSFRVFKTYEVQPLMTAHLRRIPDTAWSIRVLKSMKRNLWSLPTYDVSNTLLGVSECSKSMKRHHGSRPPMVYPIHCLEFLSVQRV